jgi:putative transposase
MAERTQETAIEWLWRYNAERSNMALGEITPYQMLAKVA